MIDRYNLCMKCMSPLQEDGRCPNCGFLGGGAVHPRHLRPGTVLAQRYLVGLAQEENGEGITYIGVELVGGAPGEKVLIREYMPSTLAERQEATQRLVEKTGSEIQYKALMEDFNELYHSLQEQEFSGIFPVREVFYENGTIYAVSQYSKTISFADFLMRSGGELTWIQAKRLLMPLFLHVSALHKVGMIHRGISPDTLRLDSKGQLYLSGFCIVSARTDRSELEAELFSGYAAPEQYSLSSWQGSWTDVYALAAVLYRTLTGTKPPEALSRKVNDNLCPPIEMDDSIPQNVSDAILHAMTVVPDQRTQTVEQFSSQLLETAEANTAVFVPMVNAAQKREEPPFLASEGEPAVPSAAEKESVKNSADAKPSKEDKKEKKQKNKSGKPPYGLIACLVTLLLLAVGLFVILKGIYDSQAVQGSSSSSSSSSSVSVSDSSSVDPNAVPNFVGQMADTVRNNADYALKYDLKFVEDYSEEYPTEGMIFDQSIREGTLMQNRGTITLSVSKGSPKKDMPNLIGSTLELAMEMLEKENIPYKVVEAYNSSYEEGLVSKTIPAYGEKVDITKDEVILITRAKQSSASSSSSTPSREESSDDEDYGYPNLDDGRVIVKPIS